MKISDISNIFLGMSRFKNEIDLNNEQCSFYRYKLLKPHLSNYLLDKDNEWEYIYFKKTINKENLIHKYDILVKLVDPLKFILVDFEIKHEYLVSSQYCILRTNNLNDAMLLWAYLNSKDVYSNIKNKKRQNTIAKFYSLTDIKEIQFDKKAISKNKIKYFYNLSKMHSLLEKKQNIVGKLIKNFRSFYE